MALCAVNDIQLKQFERPWRRGYNIDRLPGGALLERRMANSYAERAEIALGAKR
jgi:hypothetical protein